MLTAKRLTSHPPEPDLGYLTAFDDVTLKATSPCPPLNLLTVTYESNGKPGTVSPGTGDPGGISYGTYQFNTKAGVAEQFVNKYYPKQFKGKAGGTPAFSAEWKSLAVTDAAHFGSNQDAFAMQYYCDPEALTLQRNLGLNFNSRNDSLGQVAFAVAIQHGVTGGARMIENAVSPLIKTKPISSISDKELIDAIYAEDSRLTSDGKSLVYFSGASISQQRAIEDRLFREEAEALTELAQNPDC